MAKPYCMKISYLTAILFPVFFLGSTTKKEILPQISSEPRIVNESDLCGPQFTIYNTSGYTITRISVKRVGSTVFYIDNPTFPYTFVYSIGSYTFNFSIQGSSSTGSINVEKSFDSSPVTCEVFENPHAAPVAFFGSCEGYDIVVTNVPDCD